MRLNSILAVTLLVLLTGMLTLRVASGTPGYAARSGRACDTCHLTPNTWENPSLAERKCTLSCGSCHVDPAGGGLRNAAGRFYGRATLPMIATSPRPTVDWDRNLLGRRDRATTYSSRLPLGPDRFADVDSFLDTVHDGLALGDRGHRASRFSPFAGRYGNLPADPVVRIGYDLRLATLLSGVAIAFPMQADVPVDIHPVERAHLVLNTGVRGRSSGYRDTFESERALYFREAYLLVNELPYLGYLKAGRFVPSFGLRLDDHTSRIRRQFELDGSLPEARVTGLEMGVNPNYPFLQASYFRMSALGQRPASFDILDVDAGWGMALNGGYRDEGWTLGGSALLRRRPTDEGGDATSIGLYGAFNASVYRRGIPLVYQAEVDFGSFDRRSGRSSEQVALYQELGWLVVNGVNVLAAHDWGDPDREVEGDASHRFQAGVQVTPIPGITIDARIRGLVPSEGQSGADGFLQLHIWN